MSAYERAKTLLECGELNQSHRLLSELVEQHQERLKTEQLDGENFK